LISHRPPINKPHVARRRFGQHFLHERNVIERLLHEINPLKQDFIVEIGPGQGALTRPLLERIEKLHVIE
jgi:16S rRNA (adenine1518-N6/adenine1519-N6)-dimethyltransferase